MSDASDTQRCGRCGAEFTAASTPLGLCPACVLKLGMSDPAMTPVQEPEAEPVAARLPAPPPPVKDSPLGGRLVWMTAAAMGALLLVVALVSRQFILPSGPRHASISAHANSVRFTLRLPDDAEIASGAQFAVSPDGNEIALAARRPGQPQRLWVRRLQSLEWRELPGTNGAAFPFWSPDSRNIGFFADRRVKRIDVANALTQTLCEVKSGQGGTWGIDNVIMFADTEGLSRVPASGGTPVRVTRLDASDGQRAHLWPHFLPDGRRFVFTIQKLNGEAETHLAQVDTGGSVKIADGRGPAAFVAEVLLSPRGAALAAQRFDDARGEFGGEMVALSGVDEIDGSVADGSAYSASSTVLVYRLAGERRRQLVWFGRNGEHIGVAGEPDEYRGFALSPDQRRVAFARRGDDEASSLWLMDVVSGRLSRLTRNGKRDAFPIWSPDGSRIAFSSGGGNNAESMIALVTDHGGMQEDVLLKSPELKRPSDWSPDNNFLIYTARSPRTGLDLWLLPTMNDRKPLPVQQTPADESQGRWSPDGRWIAYVSDESGADEVYVTAVPASEGRWQVSNRGGTKPRWRPDGREIYFLSADGQLMAVDVRPGQTPQLGPEQPLIPLRGAEDFTVGRDGRFLVSMPIDDARDRELHVVLNWTAELSR